MMMYWPPLAPPVSSPVCDGTGSARAVQAGADLHVHTTHSDGVFSPGEVLRSAAQAGLAAVAITDHDTVSGVSVAQPEANRLGIELIPGIEMTAEHAGHEVHILGYFLDVHDEALLEATQRFRLERDQRLLSMIDALRELGLLVDFQAIRTVWPRAALGRKHLAEWLVKSQQAPTVRVAFDRYLADDAPACRPRPRIPWSEAVACIARAQGVAALAHPGRKLADPLLLDMKAAGLAGIEVNWPGQGANRVRQARERADRLGLIPLSGSDFHAPDQSMRSIGCRVTPVAELERLRACASTPAR